MSQYAHLLVSYSYAHSYCYFPDLRICKTGPTRCNRTLDQIVSNFDELVTKATVNAPIESDSMHAKSDHSTVSIKAKLTRPKAFAWETHEYLS